MNSVLVLLPSSHAANQTLCCWTLAQEGTLTQEIWSVEQLQAQKGLQCVVMVPANNLSWPSIELPAALKKQSDARLLPALQALVEDVLLDEPESMHLALPDQSQMDFSQGPISIAACHKAWLAQWLSTMEQSGIKVLKVIPEWAPDVLGDTIWCTGPDHEPWAVARHGETPLVLPLDSAAAMLTSAQPVKALPAAYQAACKAFGADRVQLLSIQECLKAQLQTQWNLAQHGFAGTWLERWRRKILLWSQTFFHARQYQPTRLACMTLAVGSALVLNIQAWRGQQALQAQRQSIVQTVQNTFTHLHIIVDAPLQMEREVVRLRQSAGVLASSDFESMAAAAGQALNAMGLRANALEFNRGQLSLEGIPAAQVEAFNTHLLHSGYRAEMAGNAVRVREKQ